MRHAVRTCSLRAEALDLVLLVILEVALEPVPLPLGNVAFPSQDVSTGAIQEPAVVRDDHGTARELLQSVLQGGQGLNIQVVSRLIQQDQVAALLQRQRQVQAVTLTTRKHLGRLLLIRPLETECGEVRTGRHFVLADVDVIQAVRDNLPNSLLGVDVFAVLIHVAQLHGGADLNLTGVWLLQADNCLKQGGLTHAVRADDAHNAVTRQGER